MSFRKLFLAMALAVAVSLPAHAQQAVINSAVPVVVADRTVAVSRDAAVTANAAHWHFHVVARDRTGKIVWTRDATNMVTRIGCTQLLTQTFKTQTAPTWYVGEIKAYTSFATADTMASHAGWTSEATSTTDITNGTRPALTLGTVANSTDTVSADNSGAVAAFTQNSTISIVGLYVTDVSTVGGATGNLYGEATFTSAPVAAGYTLNITATMSTTAG
jgi:hypothetical protein